VGNLQYRSRNADASKGHLAPVVNTMSSGAILLAAGRGDRMRGDGNKVLLPIVGREVLLHAIDAFSDIPDIHELVIVAQPVEHDIIATLLSSQRIPFRLTVGGTTRRDSALAGVRASTSSHVLIHDGARPFTSRALILRVLEALKTHAAVIPILTQTDHTHVLRSDGRHLTLQEPSQPVPIARAQTPQGFHRQLILECLETAPLDCRDDATAVLLSGRDVFTVNGDPANIKITYPEDLPLGEAIHYMRQHNSD